MRSMKYEDMPICKKIEMRKRICRFVKNRNVKYVCAGKGGRK